MSNEKFESYYRQLIRLGKTDSYEAFQKRDGHPAVSVFLKGGADAQAFLKEKLKTASGDEYDIAQDMLNKTRDATRKRRVEQAKPTELDFTEWIALARELDEAEKIDAIKEMADSGEMSINALVDLARDDDDAVIRQTAIETLAQHFGTDDRVKALATELKGDATLAIKTAVDNILLQNASEEEQFHALLQHDDPYEVEVALRKLQARQPIPDLLPYIAQCILSDDTRVRLKARQALHFYSVYKIFLTDVTPLEQFLERYRDDDNVFEREITSIEALLAKTKAHNETK